MIIRRFQEVAVVKDARDEIDWSTLATEMTVTRRSLGRAPGSHECPAAAAHALADALIPQRRKPHFHVGIVCDQARRIAANIAKLPDLLGRPQ
jgi:hypothetical protein